jgi:hypothetical protein
MQLSFRVGVSEMVSCLNPIENLETTESERLTHTLGCSEFSLVALWFELAVRETSENRTPYHSL